jgi:hypothetical protein
LDVGDGVTMDLCHLDGMQTCVEVGELALHLLKVFVEIVGEVLDQLCISVVVESMDCLVSRYQV